MAAVAPAESLTTKTTGKGAASHAATAAVTNFREGAQVVSSLGAGAIHGGVGVVSGLAAGVYNAWGVAQADGDAEIVADNHRIMKEIQGLANFVPVQVGPDLGKGTFKWSGGVRGQDDKLYFIPHNASRVLQYDTALKVGQPVGGDLGTGYGKWCGGVLGKDGCIYGIPYNARYVLKFDPRSGVSKLIGAELEDCCGKWRRGVRASDHSIVCIPYNARYVLRILPEAESWEYIGCELPDEQGKWDGGVIANNGLIYGIPCNAARVLFIDPKSGIVEMVGNKLGKSSNKWRGGCLGGDGAIYGIPSQAVQILRIDPKTNLSARVGDELGDGECKWNGGVTALDGSIYAVPCNANQILWFDPNTMTTTLVGKGLKAGVSMWEGALLGPDGCIYGVPSKAHQVLKFDPRRRSVGSMGVDLGMAELKFHSGVCVGDFVYCIPRNAQQVLRLDVENMQAEPIGEDLGESGAKYHGGVLAQNGCIYSLPHNEEYVLKIDPKESTASRVGPRLDAGVFKWNGCVLGPDGFVYGIPRNASKVLRFDPTTDTHELFGDDLSETLDKWAGGALADDGCIYCCPSSASRILRIDTSSGTCQEVGQDLGEEKSKWSGAIFWPKDGCVYFVPRNAQKMLQYDYKKEEAKEVGDNLGACKDKYSGCAVGRDQCIYCLPCNAGKVYRFDPVTLSSTLIGDDLGKMSSKYFGGVTNKQGNVIGIPGTASQFLNIFTDVAECAVLQCLGKLVGTNPDVCPCCNGEGQKTCRVCSNRCADLLKFALSDRHGSSYREVILSQWKFICEAELGASTLADHLQYCPGIVGIILNIKKSKLRNDFLALPGVQIYLASGQSVGTWLEERISDDDDDVVATLQYFDILSKMVADVNDNGIEDRRELLAAMCGLPRLLVNMLLLNEESQGKLVSTRAMRMLINLKASQPLAVFTQITETLLCTLVVALVIVYTWPRDEYVDEEVLMNPDNSTMDNSTMTIPMAMPQQLDIGITLIVVLCVMVTYELWQLAAMSRLGLGKLQLFSFETVCDFGYEVFGITVVALRMAGASGDETEYKVIVVIMLFLVYYKFLRMLMGLNQNVSTFVTALYAIGTDLLPFAVVMTIVVALFGHAFMVCNFATTEPVDQFSMVGEVWFALFSGILGNWDSDWFPTSTVLARPLAIGYYVVVFIVMMNVLIAVISESYAKAQENASIIFLKEQLQYCARLDAMGLTSPRKWPTCVVTFAKAYRKQLHGVADREAEEGEEDAEDKDPQAVLEAHLKELEKRTCTKIEASVESMLNKMEVRIYEKLGLIKPTPQPI